METKKSSRSWKVSLLCPNQWFWQADPGPADRFPVHTTTGRTVSQTNGLFSGARIAPKRLPAAKILPDNDGALVRE